MRTRTIIEYILAAIIVILLGALAGWYFFLRNETRATNAADLARGYTNPSAQAPTGNAPGASSGSNFPNTNTSAGVPSGVVNGPPNTSAQQSGQGVGGFFSRVYDAIFGNPGISDVSNRSFPGTGFPSGSTSSLASTTTSQPAVPQLWQGSKTPVAGFGFLASSSRIEYVERATGYMVALDPSTGTSVRLTNTLMPKVYEALFAADGSVIERGFAQNGDITSFAGATSTSSPASATSSVGSLAGVYLPNNILQIAVNPGTRDVFSVSQAPGGVAGTLQRWDGTKSKRLFTSSISHWQIRMLSDGLITLLEAPADGVPGYAYALSASGTMTPLLRGIPGLTILPRAGSSGALIYGSSNGTLALFVRPQNGAATIQLPIKTIADKCVWAPGKDAIAYCAVPQVIPTGTFLNAWYKGQIHTADAWWRVNVVSGKAELMYTPPTSLDVAGPQIDATGQYIGFINNTDLSFWVLRINK